MKIELGNEKIALFSKRTGFREDTFKSWRTTPVANDDTETESFEFAGWTPSIPTSGAIEGVDGSVITYTATFNAIQKQNEAAPMVLSLDNDSNIMPMSDDDLGIMPMNYDPTITVAWDRGNLQEGAGVVAVASIVTAPYYQWQVNDGKGVWYDVPYETNPTTVIGYLYGNMAGWQYRVKYGNSASDFKYSNAVTIGFDFTVALPGSSTCGGNLRDANVKGAYIMVPEEYRANVTSVSFTVTYSCGNPTSGGSPDYDAYIGVGSTDGTNLFGKVFPNAESGSENVTKAVNGFEGICALATCAASSKTIPMSCTVNNVVIKGSGGGSGTGVSMNRGTYEAWDLTTVWNDDQIIAKEITTAADKVYDGKEVNAVVTITPQGPGLTQQEVKDIISRGTIQYSNGVVVRGDATEGSGCIDVNTYTATFIPADVDKKFFTANTEEETRNMTAQFSITPRPLNIFSKDNNKMYDGTNNITVNNIVIEGTTETSGIITRDTGRVNIDKTSFDATFGGVIHQTNGEQVQITRPDSVIIALTGDRAGNYFISREQYTGAITQRPVSIHSLYLDDPTNPRNYKEYDGTNAAVIKSLIIENLVNDDQIGVDKEKYAGTYATSNAGETLNRDGTVQENRFLKLDEVVITRTAPIALTGNIYNDYYIDEENYSGAISRCILEVRLEGYLTVYGDDFNPTPSVADEYSATNRGEDKTLTISVLKGSDTLVLDGSGSFDLPEITNTTPVGVYPMSYSGLTEQHYPVLSNYVVWQSASTVTVAPRPLKITVDGGYTKQYASPNPEFNVVYTYKETNPDFFGNDVWSEGFPNSDTPKTAFSGKLVFDTDCETMSPVRRAEDGKTIIPYLVFASGYESKVNKNGMQNYDIEWIFGDITVTPRKLTVVVDDQTKVYDEDDDELTFTVKDPETGKDYENGDKKNPFDELFPDTAHRDEGEDVGDYNITIDDIDDPNFEITIEDGTLTITPRPLKVVVDDKTKVYGDEDDELTFTVEDPTDKKTYENGDTQNPYKELFPDTASREEGEDVGDYIISVEENNNKNFAIEYVDGTMTITPAKLIIAVNGGYYKEYGEENPAFDVIYKGFVRGENEKTALEGTLQYNTGSNAGALPGRYDVTASGLTSKLGEQGLPNYEIEWVHGDIQIGPRFGILEFLTGGRGRNYKTGTNANGAYLAEDLSISAKMVISLEIIAAIMAVILSIFGIKSIISKKRKTK